VKLVILTPSGAIEKDVDSVTAADSSGSFGIMARHTGFLSVLSPCILVLRKGDTHGYAAVAGGIVRVESGRVSIATRQAVEGADYAGLREMLATEFRKKEEKEATFEDLLSNMEKLLVDRMVKFERGG